MASRSYLRHTLLLLSLALLVGACGRSPAAGLEGELCAADNDCIDGLICVRRSCLPLEMFDMGSDVPQRGGLFFVILQFQSWAGATDGPLEQFGDFIRQLSTVLSPYYGFWAYSETEGRFGVVDPSSNPLNLTIEHTITEMDMFIDGTTYVATVDDTLLIPVVYADDSVELDFEMPLSDPQLTIEASSVSPGTTGAIRLQGALRAVDSRGLDIRQGDQEFTLWDVLRNVELDVDINGDGVNDSWGMRWTGIGVFD